MRNRKGKWKWMRPHEATAEVQSPVKETEETQDYVRESLAISQEEAEEMGFVPSAVGEPRGAIYWCDNRCSEKAIRDYAARNQFERFRVKLCQPSRRGDLAHVDVSPRHQETLRSMRHAYFLLIPCFQPLCPACACQLLFQVPLVLSSPISCNFSRITKCSFIETFSFSRDLNGRFVCLPLRLLIQLDHHHNLRSFFPSRCLGGCCV